MTRRKMPTLLSSTLITLSILLIFSSGCSKKNDTDSQQSGNSIFVVVTPSPVQINTNAIVEATVMLGTTPVSNLTVNFAVSPSNSGTFTPLSATTDANGIAAVVFTANTAGSANVSATISGSSVSAVRNVTISNSPQSGSGNITIQVSPSLLLANGADTSLVTITVRDTQNQPAPDGTIVRLAAGEKFDDIDGDGYFTTNVDSVIYDANGNGQWDQIGFIPSIATVSGGAGAASVNYISGSAALNVYIRATVNDNGISGFSESTLQLSPDATVFSIFLNSDQSHLSVQSTGGNETGLIHATCYDSKGNRVPEGIPVSFLILDSPGGGEQLENVGIGPFSTITNNQGMATAALHSGTVSGTVRVRATSGTALSNTTQTLISAGPPAYIVVGAEECNVPYWNNVGEFVSVTAVVSDVYLNPVNDSVAVYFSADEGTMISFQSVTQNLEGIATSAWISGNNVPTADGIVNVYAETSGGTVADTAFFYNTHFPDTVWAVGMPVSMPADGTNKVIVDVYGLDLNRNFVFEPTNITSSSRLLSVTGGNLADGCGSSTFSSDITSTILSIDESLTGGNDDGIGAFDLVTYRSPSGAQQTYSINLTTGPAYRQQCELNVQSSAFISEVVSVNVIIRDFFSNPLGDHTLIMTATQGTVQNGTQETNAYGEANGFIWVAPDSISTATITIQDTDPRGGFSMTSGITVQ